MKVMIRSRDSAAGVEQVVNPAVDAVLTKVVSTGERVLWCLPIGDRLMRTYKRQRWWLWGVLWPILFGVLLFSGWVARVVLALLCVAGAVCWRRRYNLWQRDIRSAAYVLTNRRAIILAPVHGMLSPWQLKPQIVSFYPSELGQRRVVARKDGDGDIIFWERKFWDRFCEHVFVNTLSIRFEKIPNVASVDALLNEMAVGVGSDGGADGVVPLGTRCENVGRKVEELYKESDRWVPGSKSQDFGGGKHGMDERPTRPCSVRR
jgi:hypothetical protein